jgi:hypothetical protein
MTPEQMATATTWTREQWEQAEEILGEHFDSLANQTARLATAFDAPPAVVARTVLAAAAPPRRTR